MCCEHLPPGFRNFWMTASHLDWIVPYCRLIWAWNVCHQIPNVSGHVLCCSPFFICFNNIKAMYPTIDTFPFSNSLPVFPQSTEIDTILKSIPTFHTFFCEVFFFSYGIVCGGKYICMFVCTMCLLSTDRKQLSQIYYQQYLWYRASCSSEHISVNLAS